MCIRHRLNTTYEKYWDRYEVGDEEKNNTIKIDGTETLNQALLWLSLIHI